MKKDSLLGTNGNSPLGLRKRISRTFKIKGSRAGTAGVAALVVVSLVAVGAIAVSPTAEVEHQQTVFFGGGSDTTYEVMSALDALYNQSPGCLTVDTRIASGNQGTQHLHNNTCQQEDLREDLVSPLGSGAIGHPPAGFDDDTNPLQQTRRANYDHDVFVEYFPLGSSFGVRQLQRQESPITPPPAAGTEQKCGRYVATSPAFPTGPPAGDPILKECPKIDFARASGPRSTTEYNNGLRGYGFAREGLSWVCFVTATSGCGGQSSMNPDGVINNADDNRNLTHEQIQKIMRCDADANEWHEVGGAGSVADPKPIRVYQAQGGSGTRGNWDAETGVSTTEGRVVGANGTPTNCTRSIFENDARAIDASERELAFFYFSSARHTKSESRAGTTINKVNGVAITGETVVGEVTTGVEAKPSFPYTRTVYNVVRMNDPQGNPAPVEVLEYLSETGFLCKRSSAHTTNPKTGGNFRSDVRLQLEKEGFFGLPIADHGVVGGSSHCRINTDPAITVPG